MKDELPEPLVPAEIDLRGLEYMPLLGAKLFASDFDLEASDAEFRRALRLWWAAWNQQPAASLPNSERAQAKLAGFEDEKSPTWRKVRARVLHGFELCSDGRLYHPILAKQALIAWERRVEERAGRDNWNDRKRRERAERSQLFALLRPLNIVPVFNIPMGELRALVTQHVTPKDAGHVTSPVTVTGGETSPVKTGRDGTGQEEKENPPTRTATPLADSRGDFDPDQVPTTAGLMCRAMKRAGVSDVNPGHPDLLALIAAGATEVEFIGAAKTAKERDKGFAYALGALKRQRIDAAKSADAMHRGELPAAETTYQRSMRERAEKVTPTIAAKAPGAKKQHPQEVLDGLIRRLD